jgi:IS1 family transposase
MEQFEDDGTWVWVAFDPEHKVVLAHVVGERKQLSANKLLKRVKERVAGIPSFCSDGLKFYTHAILKFYGHIVSFPRTGLRGRPKVPAMVPDKGLSYAQVIKHHQNGHLVEVEKRQIFGEYAGRASISTRFIERCNLTIRQENKRLPRKTLAFSKRTYRLDAHMTFYFASYNFYRPHGSLTHLDASGKMRKWTPMRELGITNRNWTLKELLTFPYHKTSV